MSKQRSRMERIISARKAAKTRAANKAQLDYYYRITQPGNRRMEALANFLIRVYRPRMIQVKWDEALAGYKLRKGAQYGILQSVSGRGWKVLPEGYKRAQIWYPAFWEVLLPEVKP